MVTILVTGALPCLEYVSTCQSCGTKFSFMNTEATRVLDERDGNYLTIVCPLSGCGKIVTRAE